MLECDGLGVGKQWFFCHEGRKTENQLTQAGQISTVTQTSVDDVLLI